MSRGMPILAIFSVVSSPPESGVYAMAQTHDWWTSQLIDLIGSVGLFSTSSDKKDVHFFKWLNNIHWILQQQKIVKVRLLYDTKIRIFWNDITIF